MRFAVLWRRCERFRDGGIEDPAPPRAGARGSRSARGRGLCNDLRGAPGSDARARRSGLIGHRRVRRCSGWDDSRRYPDCPLSMSRQPQPALVYLARPDFRELRQLPRRAGQRSHRWGGNHPRYLQRKPKSAVARHQRADRRPREQVSGFEGRRRRGSDASRSIGMPCSFESAMDDSVMLRSARRTILGEKP